MRKIDEIILHCSDTYHDMDIGVKEIDRWHKKRGWAGIGYHYVIKRDGWIEHGRDVKSVGAHCKGRNLHSIGVCVIGGKEGHGEEADNFTEEQMESCKILIEYLKKVYKITSIKGHNYYDSRKLCPIFDINRVL